MTEGVPPESEDALGDEIDIEADAEEESEIQAKRRVNRTVLAIAVAMALTVAIAVAGSFWFIEGERQREVQAWQVRLGIVADSRAAAVDEWVAGNFAHMRELAENASLQLYMSELALGGEAPQPGGKDGKSIDADEEAASASYLRNLLIATAERAGFKAPAPVGEVAANVERVGVAGIGLVDKDGKSLVATPDMPPMTARIRTAVAKALDGEPAAVDVYVGASGLPTMGFVLPVFGIQQDTEGAKGIGAVIGLRTVGGDLFGRLKQPGDTAKTTETYIVRAKGKGTAVEYLSPLLDGTGPLKRSMAADTPALAAADAVARPGGFAIKRDYAGTEVLAASRPIAGLPWVVVRKISRDEALAATDARLTTMLIVFVLLIVGVTVAIIAVWRHGSSLRATQAAATMKVALERFENLSKFMRVVTNSQRNIIVAVDGDGHYTFANEPAAREAGIDADDMLGKSMAGVIGPVKAHAFAGIQERVLAKFEPESHTIVFGDEDDPEAGDDFHIVQADFVPLRGDRDFPPAVLTIVNDITELTHERRRSEKMLRGLVDTLVGVVDRRDPFSANHSARVAEVARCIATEMGLDDIDCKTVDIAGNLMNLGKIFIPADVLTKTEDLSADERATIANAYLVTVDMLQDVVFEGPVVETIRQLGETWDGGGPLGLKEDEILITARVLAVANAFVGMVSARAYRGAMPFKEAADILMSETDTKMDRRTVTALVNYLENRGGNRRWAHFSEPPEAKAAQ